jgi:hypothetical protein
MEWQSCALYVAKHTLVFQFYVVKHFDKSMNFTCLMSLWYISQTGQHNTLSTYIFTLFPSLVTFLNHTARWDKLHARTAYLPLIAWIQWGSLSLKSSVVLKICKEQNLWATISQFHWLVILNKICYAAIVSPTHGHSIKLNSYLTTGSHWSLSVCLRLPRDPLKLLPKRFTKFHTVIHSLNSNNHRQNFICQYKLQLSKEKNKTAGQIFVESTLTLFPSPNNDCNVYQQLKFCIEPLFADNANVRFSHNVLTQSHATKHNRIFRNDSTLCTNGVNLRVKKQLQWM